MKLFSINQTLQTYFEKKQRERLEYKKDQLILELHKNQTILIKDGGSYTIKRVKPFFGKSYLERVYA